MGQAGIVLCGGESRRMGRAKALLPWRGRRLVQYAVEVLQPVTDEVIVVTSAALSVPALDARVVVDREPELGPLAGIREGLAATQCDLAYITAVDAPFLTSEFVRGVLSRGTPVALRIGTRLEPLAAVYPRRAADVATALLERGERRARCLVSATGIEIMDIDDDASRAILRNLNAARDYLGALEEVGESTPVSIELTGNAAIAAGFTHTLTGAQTFRELLRGLDSTIGRALFLTPAGTLSPTFTARIEHVDVGSRSDFPIGPGETVRLSDRRASNSP